MRRLFRWSRHRRGDERGWDLAVGGGPGGRTAVRPAMRPAEPVLGRQSAACRPATGGEGRGTVTGGSRRLWLGLAAVRSLAALVMVGALVAASARVSAAQ